MAGGLGAVDGGLGIHIGSVRVAGKYCGMAAAEGAVATEAAVAAG